MACVNVCVGEKLNFHLRSSALATMWLHHVWGLQLITVGIYIQCNKINSYSLGF